MIALVTIHSSTCLCLWYALLFNKQRRPSIACQRIAWF